MTYCWNKSAISTVLCPVEHLYIDLYEWKKPQQYTLPLEYTSEHCKTEGWETEEWLGNRSLST